MALSLSSVYPTSTCSSSFSFNAPQCFLHSSGTCRAHRFRVSCKTVQIETQQQQPQRIKVAITKKKRKPKPSFYQQIQDKWSMKVGSPRDKFPWQKQEELEQEDEEEEEEEESESQESEVRVSKPVIQEVSFSLPNSVKYAPWAHRSTPIKPQVDSINPQIDYQPETYEPMVEHGGIDSTNGYSKAKNFRQEFDGSGKLDREIDEVSVGFSKQQEEDVDRNGKLERAIDGVSKEEKIIILKSFEHRNGKLEGQIDGISVGVSKKEEMVISQGLIGAAVDEILSGDRENDENAVPFVSSGRDSRASTRLPWEREGELGNGEGGKTRKKWSNTLSAEASLPEHELKRLRNVSLRMLERTKVGAAGITQGLVDAIHEKWKVDEVVKLKFEEPLSLNMKRTHGILESKTGGLVIWRSGSSVVLYRGISYNLPCVKSYTKQSQTGSHMLQDSEDNVTSDGTQNVGLKDVASTAEFFSPNSPKYLKDLSKRELMDLSDLNHLLDELGPRFKDWIGREPLPVDADLLPAVVPGYQTPFRLLPYGVRRGLRDKDMTKFRRLARAAPPHFALGRSKELQGLATAMVKLWEKCAIAKIAIKRGVQNTRNERMAEELKKLTGGTLLSRNKDYIVFYRGNDFLPSVVTGVLKERRKLRDLQQDEEEQARQMTSDYIESRSKASNGQLVAGTLAETKAATTRWKNQLTIEDVNKMTRDSTLVKGASLVRHLEKKLAFAKGKLKKAEKALAKVQEKLDPADLPDDLEILTDEDRFLFRKIGLSMKPFLLLGRREVYSGTIENMHLHWKHRELVKIIVRGKSFQQVKHIAISLEAESGGLLVSLDKTTKGYAIIVYRGKNYQCPLPLRPRNLLTRRQALARSIELQRREGLKHHLSDLQERIELLKSELEEMENERMVDDGRTLRSTLDDSLFSSDSEEDEGEEAYLEVYDSGNEDNCDEHEVVEPV
ncbi:putative RNA-binding, CRM domain-containing protein [Rosa chinensis]|uniref:Putative RNA-binding, CRM domain-containing protein n=1 Tax=Rosa chinensis TaxID=74649 RepID=A0A2P6RKA7_ROSCH|nr:CRM-domain containing factor CFM3, chloroplastic/mitochondrial isoform X2 [Rosa chinensis]PRQ46855.1 putative RNA-binding, CRM domain-containing protein [Rosa chinensis]